MLGLIDLEAGDGPCERMRLRPMDQSSRTRRVLTLHDVAEQATTIDIAGDQSGQKKVVGKAAAPHTSRRVTLRSSVVNRLQRECEDHSERDV